MVELQEMFLEVCRRYAINLALVDTKRLTRRVFWREQSLVAVTGHLNPALETQGDPIISKEYLDVPTCSDDGHGMYDCCDYHRNQRDVHQEVEQLINDLLAAGIDMDDCPYGKGNIGWFNYIAKKLSVELPPELTFILYIGDLVFVRHCILNAEGWDNEYSFELGVAYISMRNDKATVQSQVRDALASGPRERALSLIDRLWGLYPEQSRRDEILQYWISNHREFTGIN